MATKLENLKITKVDFVDNGANPEANVMIFKSADPPEELDEELEDDPTADDFVVAEKKPIKKAMEFLMKAFGLEFEDGEEDELEDELEDDETDDLTADTKKKTGKVGKSFEELAEDATFEEVEKAIRMNGYGMSESMVSIMNDDDIDVKKAALLDNLQDYYDITAQAIECWADGKVHADIAKGLEEIDPDFQEVFKSARDWLDEQIEKSSNPKNNGMEEESMDLTKMSKEDRAVYDALAAKYQDAPVKKSVDDGVEDIYKGLPKAVVDELVDLRKRADAADEKELMEVAKGYEMLGKTADELLPVLKNLKATDATAYKEMIGMLDASKTAIEKSGLFAEIGKSGHGIQGMTAINKKADEVMEKDPNLNRFQAIDKVFETNPELRQEYDV